ncbi:PREDICTED: uncharacterized protein LOC105456826 [Wasmannia auropunctata]|uniref:uncharacterized protein LOC105456826 n=1 Tax=Wasmannia auropunctata TaxID=64793 RepID=UPI0005EF8AF2|nr:PREDICTED: uncharacterized protein LOC105456826 [Wasmannia auropunctata]
MANHNADEDMICLNEELSTSCERGTTILPGGKKGNKRSFSDTEALPPPSKALFFRSADASGNDVGRLKESCNDNPGATWGTVIHRIRKARMPRWLQEQMLRRDSAIHNIIVIPAFASPHLLPLPTEFRLRIRESTESSCLRLMGIYPPSQATEFTFNKISLT